MIIRGRNMTNRMYTDEEELKLCQEMQQKLRLQEERDLFIKLMKG